MNKLVITAFLASTAFATTFICANAVNAQNQDGGQAAHKTLPADSSASPQRARLLHRAAHNPNLAVMLNLRLLERVYHRDGRADEIPALYQDVIARNENPQLELALNRRLERLQTASAREPVSEAKVRERLEKQLEKANQG